MNNDELKGALFSGCPVEHNGVKYKRVTAIVYRNIKGKLHISAEVKDVKTDSVCYVEANKLKAVTDHE